MFAILCMVAQTIPGGGGGGSDVIPTIVGYGVASPLIVFLLWYIGQQQKEHKELSERIDRQAREHEDRLKIWQDEARDMSERMLAQQKELIPLARDMMRAIEEATRRLERSRE